MAAKFGFIFHTCENDFHLAKRLIRDIRSWHPDAPVTCISDGFNPPRFEQYCCQHRVKYVAGEYLKTRRLGALWLDRFFQQAIELDTEIVIKLDPDSRVNRAITFVPAGQIAGYVDPNPRPQDDRVTWGVPRGGGIAWSKGLLKLLAEKRLHHEDRYRDASIFAYRRYCSPDFSYPWDNDQRLVFSEDMVIGEILSRLEISVEPWSEVCICFREKLPDNWKEFAITHPHPYLEGGLIVGCGAPKTGTKSLAEGLRRIGYKSLHCPRTLEVIPGYEAVTDGQARDSYQEIDRQFPGSKFILTLRDVNDWIESCRRHFESSSRLGSWKSLGEPSEAWIQEYNRHVAEVRDYFRDRPQDLLEMRICNGDGYAELCRFLNIKVEPGYFPHLNRGDEL